VQDGKEAPSCKNGKTKQQMMAWLLVEIRTIRDEIKTDQDEMTSRLEAKIEANQES
jgi:hypothetical protein